ncbi:MAG TPA: extracellular solute-binding protein, partial [Miltoncostaeales bacterium]|jgi:multiple sugar transport system substrate-binding protein|nr:extracellular solute-binding protein [Miltoncostaeales bacterium]
MLGLKSFGRLALVATAATAAMTLAACGGGSADETPTTVDKAAASGDIVVWVHGGATDAEKAAANTIVDGFNTSQSKIKASVKFIPDQQKVITATPAEQLGDVVEADGEAMSANVYAGKFQALDGLISQDVLDNQTSSTTAQNTYAGDGKRYMLSMFDSGLALYGNKKLLDAAGVKYPTTWDTAWTVEQFDAALKALATKDKDGKVLDVKENYGLSGYSTYAFLPIISSAGHLVMEDGKADGALNSEPVVAAFTKVAGWKQYTDANADDKAFTAGRVGLSWVGHWVYNDYKKALGDDLVVIPLPNFGTGAKTGQGSLAWGISKGSKNAAAAAVFLEYAMSDASVKAMTDANSAPPGTKSVTATSPLYKADGPLALYADGLSRSCGNEMPTTTCVAVPRTISAGWPTINAKAGDAMNSIWTGGDPKEALDKAAQAIDQDFTDNDGYAVK